MNKNEFLDAMTSAFLAQFPRWSVIHEDRRKFDKYVGIEIPGMALVFIEFSCGADNMRVHHAVGWSESRASFFSEMKAPIGLPKPRDGSLHRLRKLEQPRDFQYAAMTVSIRLLHKPYDGFDLVSEPVASIQATMMQEIQDYAFPYLCMMLKQRHGIEVTPEKLGSGSID